MEQNSIILFDGICNLCNHTVQFIIKNDPNKKFLFTSLQSDTGIELLKKYGLSTIDFKSFILIEGDKVYTKSTAALKIARQLKKPVRFLYGFIIIPKFIRDFFYSIIASNRYRLFGKNSVCMVPSPENISRFI
jgi:predicted DCC family thiol-disulfide oxidoreductase YuxK